MKKMAKWEDYVEFEKKHTEDVSHTKAFFVWVLDNFGQHVKDKKFERGLEIGVGLSGGFLPFLDIDDKVAVDYVHGPIKEKAENLSFSDNSFDLVVISNTLDHCQEPKKVAREIKRVLKQGGLLFLFNYFDEPDNHPWSYSTSDEITPLFKGMKILSLTEYPKTKRNPFMVATLQK